jgi:hypothetical protein
MLSARPAALPQDENASQHRAEDTKDVSKPKRKGLTVLSANSNVPQPTSLSAGASRAKAAASGKPRRCGPSSCHGIACCIILAYVGVFGWRL